MENVKKRMNALEGKYTTLVLENAMIYEDVRSTAVQTREKYYDALDEITFLKGLMEGLRKDNLIKETTRRRTEENLKMTIIDYDGQVNQLYRELKESLGIKEQVQDECDEAKHEMFRYQKSDQRAKIHKTVST